MINERGNHEHYTEGGGMVITVMMVYLTTAGIHNHNVNIATQERRRKALVRNICCLIEQKCFCFCHTNALKDFPAAGYQVQLHFLLSALNALHMATNRQTKQYHVQNRN